MPRIRSICPEACTSESLATVSAEAERCYWRLQTHCDDEGRAEDHPRLIWAALFPLHDVGPSTVNDWLDELAEHGLIARYEAGGKRYLYVTQWERFQHPQKPKPSKLPAPSETLPRLVRDTADTGNGQVSPGEGVGGGEGVGDAPTGAAPVGVPKPKAHRIPDEFVVTAEMESWARTKCPDIDWRIQTEKFVNHWKAKGGRDATKLDWLRTWRNWLLTSQEWATSKSAVRTHL